MRIPSAVVAVTLLLLLAGCIAPSLHPICTAEDATVDPALLGTWLSEPAMGEEASQEVWTFEKGEDKAYRLTITADGMPAPFEARLVRLGGRLFLDLFPGRFEGDDRTAAKCLNGYCFLHCIPAHSIWSVHLEPDQLRLAALDPDWLRETMAFGRLKLRCEELEGGDLVITAATKELQHFLSQHGGTTQAFDDPIVLLRQKQRPQQAQHP